MILAFDPIQLLTPDLGLVFWTTLAFAAFWFIMGKFAFRPILTAIKTREDSISDALESANKAKEEMKLLHADNERILAEAKDERMKILKEAKEVKDAIIAEAHTKANEDKTRIIAEAKSEIEKQKNDAIREIKQEVSNLSVDIAEKILRGELDKLKLN
jgi:F-type H+-transporting ATPase subunit b